MYQVFCRLAYIHEVGQPLHRQFRGGIAVCFSTALRQSSKLLQRHPIVAHQAAQASGFIKRNSEKTLLSSMSQVQCARGGCFPTHSARFCSLYANFVTEQTVEQSRNIFWSAAVSLMSSHTNWKHVGLIIRVAKSKKVNTHTHINLLSTILIWLICLIFSINNKNISWQNVFTL